MSNGIDPMLDELYMRVFQTKQQVERLATEQGESADRQRQVAIAKNQLLNELIGIRTEQLRQGRA